MSGVIQNTLPVTLTEKLAGHLDTATGLQYDGLHYYDPWLGSYVQPDPFGGLPEAPGSLNRYAMTPGSPPSYEPSPGGGWAIPPLAVDIGKSTLPTLMSAGLNKGWLGPAAGRLVNRMPWHRLNVEITSESRRGIRAPLSHLLKERAGDVSVARRLSTGSLDEWSGIIRLGEDYQEWAGRLARRGVSVQARSVARGVWNFGPRSLTVGDITPGVGADLVVGGLWQLGSDILFHPELMNDPGLLARRAAAGSLSTATSGLGGTALAGGAARVIMAAGVTPPGWVVVGTGVVITIGIDALWGKQIKDWSLERLNAHAPWD